MRSRREAVRDAVMLGGPFRNLLSQRNLPRHECAGVPPGGGVLRYEACVSSVRNARPNAGLGMLNGSSPAAGVRPRWTSDRLARTALLGRTRGRRRNGSPMRVRCPRKAFARARDEALWLLSLIQINESARPKHASEGPKPGFWAGYGSRCRMYCYVGGRPVSAGASGVVGGFSQRDLPRRERGVSAAAWREEQARKKGAHTQVVQAQKSDVLTCTY